MKKLNKLVLNKAKVMTAPEMKHISGGLVKVCCRGIVDQDGDGIVDPGCHNGEFWADSCDGHRQRCGGYFYTCG